MNIFYAQKNCKIPIHALKTLRSRKICLKFNQNIHLYASIKIIDESLI